MANAEDVEKWEKQYGSATAGGAIVKNAEGKVVGNIPYSEDTGRAFKNNGTMYKTPEGTYTSVPVASMSIDKGKVTFNVSDIIANSDWFKDNFTNNDTFKSIAAAYKVDPTGTTALKYTDANGEEKERTIADLLKSYQDTLQEFQQNYGKILDTRAEVRSTTKSNMELSDNDILIYGSATNRNDDKFRNDVPVYLPDFAFSYFDFTKLPSYNAENKAISAKDFYEWYNLDDGTPGKDELITRLTDATANAVSGWQKWQGQTEADTDFDPDAAGHQYARSMSFYRTLMNDNPEANPLTTARLFVGSMANSLWDNLSTSTGNMMTVAQSLVDKLDEIDDVVTPLKVATVPIKTFWGGTRLMGDELYMLGSLIDNPGRAIDDIQISGLGVMSLLGAIGNSVVDGDPSELFDMLEKAAGIKDKATIKELRDTTHNLLLDAHNDMTRLSSAATAGSIAGGAVAEILKQAVVTNVVGGEAGNIVGGIAGGINAGAQTGNIYGRILFSMSSPEDIIMGFKMLSASMTGKQLAGAVKAGAFSANIVAQGLSDTILNDGDALKKMIMESDGGDALQAIGLNTLANGIGELLGFGQTRGWRAIKATSTGQAIQAAEQRGINRLAAGKHKALGRLAETMNRLTGNADGQKIGGAKFNTAYHYQMSDASKNIANAANLKLEGETLTEATNRLVMDKVNLEVSYGRISRHGMRTVLELQTNPKVAQYYKDTVSAAELVAKLEKAAGVAEEGRKIFTQDTANYIARSNRIEYLTAKGGPDLKNLSTAETHYLTLLKKKVAEYRANTSPELLDAIEDYVAKLKAYQYRFNTLLAREGVIDRASLKSWRETGYWGEDGKDYIVTQAKMAGQTDTETAKWLVDNISSGDNFRAKIDMEEYKYKPGDENVDYMDPQLAAYSQQVAAAKVIDGRNWGDALLKTQVNALKIDMDGKPVSTSEIKRLRTQARNAASDALKRFTQTGDYSNYRFGVLYKNQLNLSERIAKKKANIETLLKLNDDRLNSIALDIDQDGIAFLSRRFDIPEYGIVRTRAELDAVLANATPGQRLAIEQATGIENITVRSYNTAIRDTDLSERLTRNYIADSKNILKSKTFQRYATEVRTKELTARQQTTLKKYYDQLAKLEKEASLKEIGEDGFTLVVNDFTNDLVAEVSESMRGNKFFEEMLKRYTDAGINEKQAVQFLALENIKQSIGKKNFKDMLSKNLNSIDIAGNLTTRQRINYTKHIEDAIKSNISSEYHSAARVITKNGGSELVDMQALYDDIYEYMDDIVKTQVKAPNVVQVMERDGTFSLYQVSPVTAYLYNSRPNFSNVKSNVAVRFFNQTNRIFRLMTTGWGLSSFENQWMRDPFNAYVMGGLTRGINSNAEEIGRLLGDGLTSSIQKELGPGAQVKQEAELLYNEASPETEYVREMATGRRESLFGDYEKPVGKMERAMRTLEEHNLGNSREIYLRKANYVQAYNDALSLSHTTKEAKNIAELVADNATTDFSRSFAWGNTITNSVPYLGAAINGSASFWRLLEIDPLGVSGRFFSGLALPQLALVTQSLSSEENRKAYMSVPEYVKQDNLVFAADGQVFKIPIPQELSAFLQPFRYVVEKAMGGTDETWGELLLNNLLAVSPVDLTGFADLDDPLGKDADFFSRLSSEGETLISQLAPVVLKTAYMAATGRDPYTQSPIDRSRVWFDEEGNLQIVDSEDNAFAQWVADTLNGFGIKLSASSAEALLSQLFGQAPIDFAGALGEVFSGDPIGALGVYGKQIAKPFSPSSYDQLDAAWKDQVRELTAEKNELMRPDGELVAINNKIGATSDPNVLKNLRAQYREIVQNYRDHVLDAVRRFNSVAGADYDWKKFASTLQLLSFYSTPQDLTTEDAKQDAQQLYFDAQNKAKQTMADMGFNGVNDLSIFGYLKMTGDGKAEVRATSPVAILNMNNVFYQARDESIARITTTINNVVDVDGKTLKDKYKEMKDKESELYAKKDYNGVNKLYKEWDVEFMSQIYPLIAQNGLMDDYGNNLLDNKEFVQQIGQYLRVPTDFMGKGKYISSSTGLDKQTGYKKAYIQYLFEQLGGQ